MSEVRLETKAPSFFERYMHDQASADEIDDFVGEWHEKFAGQTEYPPLHEYLGLTHDEYEVLMYDPFALPLIRHARQGADLVQLMMQRYAQLCAANRREDGTIIFSLRNWLQRLGRL